MEYNKSNAKRWAVMGQRPTFGLALYELAKDNPDILAVVADVTNSAGLARMKAELPEQVINVGIAEQNMMGVATGLSSEGYTVFTASFAPLATPPANSFALPPASSATSLALPRYSSILPIVFLSAGLSTATFTVLAAQRP